MSATGVVLTAGDAFAGARTPALLLDLPRLRRNAERMRARATALGVTLRPHLKTAKSIPVAEVLTSGGPRAVMVSTLAEAEYFHARGWSDITYGVCIEPHKFERAAALVAGGCRLTVLVDSVEVAEALAAYCVARGVVMRVLVEIDTDGHRGGVDPDSPTLVSIGRALCSGRTPLLAGVLTHAGESYAARSPDEIAHIAVRERDGIVRAADQLRAAGLPVDVVSLGSTPTATFAADLRGVTELRAGVYAFGDLVQLELGTCSFDALALSVLTTVIGHKRERGRVLVDAGWMALSGDRGTATARHDWHYGAVCTVASCTPLADVTLRSANQEHGVIEARDGLLDVDRFPIGTRLRILPNHACATAAAFGSYDVVEEDGRIVARWERHNGW